MEDDLDQIVHKCVAMLMSNDPELIMQSAELLQALMKERESMEKVARVVQEIAAYRGGAVLNLIWMGTLGRNPSNTGGDKACEYFIVCTAAFQVFTSSKAVVERYLTTIGANERESARAIYEALSSRPLSTAQAFSRGKKTLLIESFIIRPLDCLANFAKGSKVFRDVIKDFAEQRSIFDTFGTFLSAEFLGDLRAEDQWSVRVALTSLAEALAFSNDSQLWALDKGLLKLISAIYEHSPLEDLKNKSKPALKHKAIPVMRCTAVLMYLLERESTLEKLRAHNALAGFKPHRRKIDAASMNCYKSHGGKVNGATILEGRYWGYMEAKLQGVPVTLALGNERIPPGYLRKQMRGKDGGMDVQVVCSWKLCTAGEEQIGRKFGKCSVCQVARYCSKEHQSLHWRTHKVHCRAKDSGGSVGTSERERPSEGEQ
ncbi:hypothetical protein KFL_001370200 [Klebsormidium nitens]|uniref:MYND-type domain-containing protein n=1 Tax=Klebsormidium nitens TaxID=105231 RepID=A0A1Y1HWV9_KLENI|nr:hypothetical protein KFL_001370200 [Klebsormidium nitens]|eukprot:GAQ83150.1 hypothetical protein KFL_001370200 [Klebsormidium nitens]